MVTETVVDLDKPPLEPVTGTVTGATPVAQVTDKVAPVNEPLQPIGKVKPELTAHVTVPENPLIPVAVQAELPATVARVVIAGQDGVKSWIVAVKLVLLDNVAGAVPGVPVTGTVDGAGAVGQTTETVAPELVTVQPGGGIKPELRANATVPVKPLIAVTTQVVEPETVARVVTLGHDMLKSTTWNETVKVGTATTPYVAGCSGTPVILNPLGSKREFRPLLSVTVSGFPVVPLKKTLVPVAPFTAVKPIVNKVKLPAAEAPVNEA